MFLQRMYPTFPLGSFGREMDRLLDGVVGPLYYGSARDSRAFPAVNVWEDGDNIYAEAEVPGVTMDEIELNVVDNELSIKGERKSTDDDSLTYHRRERGTGGFSRFITLPTAVAADEVNAVLKNGVLTITLPKSAAAKPRRIEVKAL